MRPTGCLFYRRENITEDRSHCPEKCSDICFTGRQISGLMLLKMYWHLALYCINFLQKRRLLWTIHTSCSVQTARSTPAGQTALPGGWNAHNEGKAGAKYTRAKRPVKLVYYEGFATKEEAMSREYRIKQLTREKKLELMRFWILINILIFQKASNVWSIMQRNWKIRICMFCWILLVSQHNNWIKGISIVDPLTATIIFCTDIFNYGQTESMVGDIFFWCFVVEWLCRIFAVFHVDSKKTGGHFWCYRDKRCFRTGSVAAFYSIIQQVEKYTAQFRRGNIGFLRKKNLVGNFDIFCMARNLLSARMALIRLSWQMGWKRSLWKSSVMAGR